jgi:hypothetical protein
MAKAGNEYTDTSAFSVTGRASAPDSGFWGMVKCDYPDNGKGPLRRNKLVAVRERRHESCRVYKRVLSARAGQNASENAGTDTRGGR